MPIFKICIGLWLSVCLTTPSWAVISVRDDYGNTVVLPRPAQRVISMAPHVTELLYAASGGERIVGAVNYSDFPEAAKAIARIGDNQQVDIERIIAMKPDLLVVWSHGGSKAQIDQLQRLGIPVFYSEPHHLNDIADSIERLGHLLGTDLKAQASAAALRQRLATLRNRYSARSPVRLFYQVWDQPLYTLNGSHIVSDAISLCGGENIFSKLTLTAPVVTIESVLQENPEVIISTAERSTPSGGANLWKSYPILTAVRQNNLMTVDGNLMNRAGPRMIDGTAMLCEKLEQARQHRKVAP